MMKLSVMRDFLEQVALNPDSTLIDGLLNQWGYDKGTVSFIRASNNFIFKFSQAGKHYILRLTDTEKVSQRDIESELAFLRYLHANNVCVNIPLKTLAGQEIEVCHTPVGSFYAVVFNYFEGRIYDIDELDETQFEVWGEALGGLHHASASCSSIQRASSFDHLSKSKELLSVQEQAAHKELVRLTHWLEALPKTDANYGLIHFDFELDNLIWNGDRIQIIDFDGSIASWYVADIAFALRDLFNDDIDLSNKHFLAFIKGYRKKMDVSQQDLSQIPMFFRLHNLETFITLQMAMDIEEGNSQKNPQWIMDLLHKLERKAEQYRESFA
ncbi:hypothetical protein KDW_42260 [Dictyobacter vulcani]|uniref:Aminoglycoside phosphotransferase domain-containing protein n=1 Tax=Dictyobacter vulcani TaxID=2607529 RepID=A0A5J4KKW8_9CHLR|nr:phosphotransferase [Dictyobacter vulcani]GER90064.1 hypothetical protein KDW_42260 [Dictyobacter vulcani]